MTQLITAVVSGARAGRHNNIDGRLTGPVSPHPYAFYQMRYVDRTAVAFRGGDRLDCCNGRLFGVADSQLQRLQLVYRTRDLH